MSSMLPHTRPQWVGAAAVVLVAVALATVLLVQAWHRRQVIDEVRQAVLVGCLERAQTAADTTAATNACLDDLEP